MGCCENKPVDNEIEACLSERTNSKVGIDELVYKVESAEFKDISLTSEAAPTLTKRKENFVRISLESSFILSTASADDSSIKLLTPKFTDMSRKKSNPSSPKFSFASNPTMISEENDGILMPHPPLSNWFNAIPMPECLEEVPDDFEVVEYTPTVTPEKSADISHVYANAEFGEVYAEEQSKRPIKDIIKDLNSFFKDRKEAKVSVLDLSFAYVDKPVVTGRRPRSAPRCDSLF